MGDVAGRKNSKPKPKGLETLIPGSWPKSGPFKPKKEDRKPKMFCEFVVEGFDKDGGCPEHFTAGAYLVKDYAYEYPDGSVRNMSIGWVCAGCLRRGWTWDGDKKVTIHPSPKHVRRRIYSP